MTLLPMLRQIQRPTTQGHSSHAKYENSRNSILRAWAHNEGYCVTSDNARRRSESRCSRGVGETKPRQSRDEAEARSGLRALSRVL